MFDLFFKDMDRSLREMGAGDLAVPKKIQKMGAMFYGLLQTVAEALDQNDPAVLDEVLRRNVFGDADASPGTAPLATYLRAESDRLARMPTTTITTGQLEGTAA